MPENIYGLQSENQTSTQDDSRLSKKIRLDIDVSVIGGPEKAIEAYPPQQEQTNSQVKDDMLILKGVTVYAGALSLEMISIVNQLGGVYSWTCNKNCTHFIYDGKLSDTNEEMKVAKDQGMKIVSSSWVYECREKGKKVDEHEHLIPN